VPPDEAIKASTSTAARIMGLEDTIGTIAPGRIADVIVVDGNPLTDIGTLRKVVRVIKGGDVVGSDTTLLDGLA